MQVCKILSFLILLLSSFSLSYAQQGGMVKGKVTDGGGDAVIGAQV